MKQVRSTFVRSMARGAVAAVALAALASPLLAQTPDAVSPAATYRQQRADCMAGRTTQSRALCLYDARLALEAAREGRLEVADDEQRARNVVARCDGVPSEARDGCLRIAHGEGQRDGSVEQGIVVMWLAEGDSVTSVAATPGTAPQ